MIDLLQTFIAGDITDTLKDKKVVVFGLPGAFTPTCSSTHLPEYEKKYDEIIKLGIDEVICVSVNDSFVMDAWFKDLGIEKVKYIADGEIEFTGAMDMTVLKTGMGERSWRYSAVVENGKVIKLFEEEGKDYNRFYGDPFEVSDVDTMIKYLKGTQPKKVVKKKTTRTRKKKTNVETPKD